MKVIVRGYTWTVMPITWRNRRTGEANRVIVHRAAAQHGNEQGGAENRKTGCLSNEEKGASGGRQTGQPEREHRTGADERRKLLRSREHHDEDGNLENHEDAAEAQQAAEFADDFFRQFCGRPFLILGIVRGCFLHLPQFGITHLVGFDQPAHFVPRLVGNGQLEQLRAVEAFRDEQFVHALDSRSEPTDDRADHDERDCRCRRLAETVMRGRSAQQSHRQDEDAVGLPDSEDHESGRDQNQGDQAQQMQIRPVARRVERCEGAVADQRPGQWPDCFSRRARLGAKDDEREWKDEKKQQRRERAGEKLRRRKPRSAALPQWGNREGRSRRDKRHGAVVNRKIAPQPVFNFPPILVRVEWLLIRRGKAHREHEARPTPASGGQNEQGHAEPAKPGKIGLRGRAAGDFSPKRAGRDRAHDVFAWTSEQEDGEDRTRKD